MKLNLSELYLMSELIEDKLEIAVYPPYVDRLQGLYESVCHEIIEEEDRIYHESK